MLAPYAAKVRVMTDEIGELSALLHEIAACQSVHLLLETAHAEQLAQHVPRVVEAQRLIKIRCQQVMLCCCPHAEAPGRRCAGQLSSLSRRAARADANKGVRGGQ